MSFVPSQYLVRLQELKLWQGNYDNLLQKQKNNLAKDTELSDLDDLDDVTPISEKSQIKTCESVDWDQQAILPKTKPFNELIEEKLAVDEPIEVSIKTKKPFLRKGSGLARYNLNPIKKKFKEQKIIQNNQQKRHTDIKGIEQKCHADIKGNASIKSNADIKGNEEKYYTDIKGNEQAYVENSITPLKAPEINIKSKATWTKVINEENPVESSEESKFNPQYVIEKINEFAHSFCNSKKYNDEKILESYFDRYNHEDMLENSFSNQSEEELHIFETLEKKINHSSFVSTNTSVIRLLASTPNSVHTSPQKNTNDENLKMCQEIQSSNVLTKILNNLKLISAENTKGEYRDNSSARTSRTNSFSEDKKYVKNPDSYCLSPSSFYTDFESTLERFNKINTAVNTSFSQNKEASCQNCIDLQDKLEKLLYESTNVEVEKRKLCDLTKELEHQCRELTAEIEKLKLNYDKDIEDLREELDEERKKFAREKALLDMYVKDVRPKKKDSIEMDSLKKELIDLKELMKLKETKNGTTQARLRNQIRQLEKEKSELKLSVEQLQKENGKLSASQKINRNAEARMLQEINRNLHRLTEETIKDGDLKKDNRTKFVQKKDKRRGMGELKERVERELQVEVIYNNELVDKNLVKQNESSTGLVNNEFGLNEGTNQRKKVLIEREFPDGLKEIKFTNGTIKTISPGGKLIYLQYSNGDIRETDLIKNTEKYYFLKKDIWLTKHSDGTELIEFPNGQKEERFPDGRMRITAVDGTTLTTYKEGNQEINYPDGSKMVKNKEEKIIYLTNGQKETHTPQFKKREYPDGTIKIIYPDGTQESRYANGRVRIKDENGTLLMDSHINETQ
ncbi:cytadherence high molecular weight protein 2 isoform X2 [Diorhabda sublineata]|uniref:cytadherence high molecular weight protein 2 isoform X2 n=1 Tax=Diorhabda sublineata TaxID=1163346 RepID=UPI0024E049FD|nr:cytadherence high molecular weight protein 2 isoform X2 [Diorhabda sublineata]